MSPRLSLLPALWAALWSLDGAPCSWKGASSTPGSQQLFPKSALTPFSEENTRKKDFFLLPWQPPSLTLHPALRAAGPYCIPTSASLQLLQTIWTIKPFTIFPHPHLLSSHNEFALAELKI